MPTYLICIQEYSFYAREIAQPCANEAFFFFALCHRDHKALCHGNVRSLWVVEANNIASDWRVYLYAITPLVSINLDKRWVNNDAW